MPERGKSRRNADNSTLLTPESFRPENTVPVSVAAQFLEISIDRARALVASGKIMSRQYGKRGRYRVIWGGLCRFRDEHTRGGKA